MSLNANEHTSPHLPQWACLPVLPMRTSIASNTGAIEARFLLFLSSDVSLQSEFALPIHGIDALLGEIAKSLESNNALVSIGTGFCTLTAERRLNSAGRVAIR